jgi:hypothetical protein
MLLYRYRMGVGMGWLVYGAIVVPIAVPVSDVWCFDSSLPMELFRGNCNNFEDEPIYMYPLSSSRSVGDNSVDNCVYLLVIRMGHTMKAS